MNNSGQLTRKRVLPIMVVLTLLTLLSSCSVRKSIQNFLDIPVTKQLNPSKTTVAVGQHCASFENVLLYDHSQDTNVEIPTGFALPFSVFTLPIFEKPDQQLVQSGRFRSSKIPIYILYKKMKLWV